MDYNERYRKTKDLFGPEPEAVLKRYCRHLGRAEPVLDIGAGQGRNALFLAREGWEVVAIDPSEAAVQTILAAVRAEALPVKAYQNTFEDFECGSDHYAGILVFGLVQILPWRSIRSLIQKVGKWARAGTLVFVTAFTTADDSYERFSLTWNKTGKNSFSDEESNSRTFLEKGEILSLFDGYDVLHHWEGPGPEHRHGDGPPERHGTAEAVFRKQSSQ